MSVVTLAEVDRILKEAYPSRFVRDAFRNLPVPIPFSTVADRREWVYFDGMVHPVVRTPMGTIRMRITEEALAPLRSGKTAFMRALAVRQPGRILIIGPDGEVVLEPIQDVGREGS